MMSNLKLAGLMIVGFTVSYAILFPLFKAMIDHAL